MNRKYTYTELMEMSIIDLASIAENSRIEIQNSFRKGLITDILKRQGEDSRVRSELHARDRYALIYGFKTVMLIIALITAVGFTNYASAAPKGRKSGVSAVQKMKYKVRKHKCKLSQQARTSKGNKYTCWDRRPKGSWPFEFLQ